MDQNVDKKKVKKILENIRENNGANETTIYLDSFEPTKALNKEEKIEFKVEGFPKINNAWLNGRQ